MPYVTVYYQGHKVEFMPIHTSYTRRWLVWQNDEQFKVHETDGAARKYDLYSPNTVGDWGLQEVDIPSLDAVARVICDTVYI
jgi:hypothetical protein